MLVLLRTGHLDMRVLATDNDSGKEKGILTARSQAVLMEMYREGGYAWGEGAHDLWL